MPERHFPFLAQWPPGHRSALALWEPLPWRLRQLLAVSEHEALQPGLATWRAELGFELVVLTASKFTEPEFRLLARRAAPSMSFLRGLLWRADHEVARTRDWAELQALLVTRDRAAT